MSLNFNVLSVGLGGGIPFTSGAPMTRDQMLVPANLVFGSIRDGSVFAMDRLARDDGMPKFLRDEVSKQINEEFKKAETSANGTKPGAHQPLNDETKSELERQTEDLAQKLVDNIRKQLTEEAKDSTAANRAGSASGGKGKKSAISWLQAIAKALGEVLGEKARKMTELSQKVSDAADAQKAAGDDRKAQQDAAAQMTKVQTELQGVAQEYKLLSETISTVIKSIGESLATMGRKQ